jgi:hypothetical protein
MFYVLLLIVCGVWKREKLDDRLDGTFWGRSPFFVIYRHKRILLVIFTLMDTLRRLYTNAYHETNCGWYYHHYLVKCYDIKTLYLCPCANCQQNKTNTCQMANTLHAMLCPCVYTLLTKDIRLKSNCYAMLWWILGRYLLWTMVGTYLSLS